MNEWVAEIATFVVQTTIVMALIGIGLLLVARTKNDKESDLKLSIEPLNDQRRRRGRRLRLAATLPGARKSCSKRFAMRIKSAISLTSLWMTLPNNPAFGYWIFTVI